MATVTTTDLERLPDIEELFLQSDAGAAVQRLGPSPAVVNVQPRPADAADCGADSDAVVQPQVPGSQRLWIRRVKP